MVLLAVFLPFVAVFLECGLGKHFWINIILCIFFWVPGVVHALIVVLTDVK